MQISKTTLKKGVFRSSLTQHTLESEKKKMALTTRNEQHIKLEYDAARTRRAI